jgi:hypothetical protein
MRKVIVNNQAIIEKKNISQINFLTKIDERIQKELIMINNRITRDFENELTMMQIQIITQIGQKVELMDVGVQKIKKELFNMIKTGLKRFYSVNISNNDTSIGNMFESVRNLFLLNETKGVTEHENIKLMLDQGIDHLDRLIVDDFLRVEKTNDIKLTTIDSNICVVYNEIESLTKEIESDFLVINNNMAIMNNNNNKNLRGQFD